MRVVLATCIFLLSIVGANASYLISPTGGATEKVHQRGSARVRSGERFVSRSGYLSSPYRLAAAQGGICGLFAQEKVFGSSARIYDGMNLWLADTWRLAFQRTEPHVGAVAVWPHRHVAVIVGTPRPGRIIVADSWATHEVSTAGLVIVDPHAGHTEVATRRRYARSHF